MVDEMIAEVREATKGLEPLKLRFIEMVDYGPYVDDQETDEPSEATSADLTDDGFGVAHFDEVDHAIAYDKCRTAAPLLCDEVERLRAENAELLDRVVDAETLNRGVTSARDSWRREAKRWKHYVTVNDEVLLEQEKDALKSIRRSCRWERTARRWWWEVQKLRIAHETWRKAVATLEAALSAEVERRQWAESLAFDRACCPDGDERVCSQCRERREYRAKYGGGK